MSDIDEPVPEKRVSWAELYFDLVFVFAVTEVSVLLHGDHSGAGVLRALVLFVPLYWAWVGTSVHANTQDVENATDRVGIFAVGLASLFMALAVPDAYGHRGVLFGAGYLALRAVLAALFFRRRPVTLNSFSVGLAVTGPLLLAGGFAPDGWRLVLWTLAGLVDLATPALVRARLVSIRFDPAHLPERFGLLLLIALGESIVAVGENASHEPLRPSRLDAVALAFTVVCGLWWVYFAFAAGAVRYAVATAEVQTDIIRQVLAYGHLCLIGAVIGVAVGLAEVVSRPTERLTPGVPALLFGGCAVYLATFGYTRWRMFGIWSWTRTAAAAGCLVLLPVAVLVPGIVALGALAVVVVGVNGVEGFAVWRYRTRRAGPATAAHTGSQGVQEIPTPQGQSPN